jgi:hypothetical protein
MFRSGRLAAVIALAGCLAAGCASSSSGKHTAGVPLGGTSNDDKALQKRVAADSFPTAAQSGMSGGQNTKHLGD